MVSGARGEWVELGEELRQCTGYGAEGKEPVNDQRGFPCSRASPSRPWRHEGTHGVTAKSDRNPGTGGGEKTGRGGQSTTSQLDDLFSSLSLLDFVVEHCPFVSYLKKIVVCSLHLHPTHPPPPPPFSRWGRRDRTGKRIDSATGAR